MVDLVGVGEALHRVCTMAEGQHRRGQHKTQRREGCESNCDSKAQAGPESCKHATSPVGIVDALILQGNSWVAGQVAIDKGWLKEAEGACEV
jgi:hypothetical protein